MLDKKYLWTMVVAFVFLSTGCVDQIDFDGGTAEFLIIDGVITNSPGERTIFVRKRIGQRIDTSQVTATGSLLKNGSVIAELIPFENTLKIPDEVLIEAGASYSVQIITNEGNTYTSLPQVVQAKLSTDSLTVDVERKQIGISGTTGLRLFDWYVNLYAHVTIPTVPGPKVFYRWQIDESWSIVEIPKEDNPFDIINVCYFSSTIRAHQPVVFDANALASGPAKVYIGDRQISEAFTHRHYFNAYAHSITEEAYRYYDRASSLISGQGDVFQEVPAPLSGNIRNVDGDETVLGFIEFSLADTQRVLVLRADIGRSIPYECDFDPPDEVCYDCILRFGASFERPYYWD